MLGLVGVDVTIEGRRCGEGGGAHRESEWMGEGEVHTTVSIKRQIRVALDESTQSSL